MEGPLKTIIKSPKADSKHNEESPDVSSSDRIIVEPPSNQAIASSDKPVDLQDDGQGLASMIQEKQNSINEFFRDTKDNAMYNQNVKTRSKVIKNSLGYLLTTEYKKIIKEDSFTKNINAFQKFGQVLLNDFRLEELVKNEEKRRALDKKITKLCSNVYEPAKKSDKYTK